MAKFKLNRSFKKKQKADKVVTSMIDHIIEQQVKTESKLIQQVLKQYLDRDPIEEDATKIKKIKNEVLNDRYLLVFDNVALGEIIKLSEADNFSVKFEPIKSMIAKVTSENVAEFKEAYLPQASDGQPRDFNPQQIYHGR